MKILVLVVLLFVCVQTEAANNKKYKAVAARAPNMSAVQMLNFRQFQTLPIEKKMEYINEIRRFLIKEEKKWPDRKIASFSVDDIMNFILPSAFAQTLTAQEAAVLAVKDAPVKAGSGCSIDTTSLTAFQTGKLNANGETCIKGGFLICVTPDANAANGFRCLSSDLAYAKISKDLGCAPGSSACMPPAFMAEGGKTLCVTKAEANNTSTKIPSVSQACLDKQTKQNISHDDYEKFFKAHMADYKKMKANIDKQCTAPNSKKWGFDATDCKALDKHLTEIASIYTGTKTQAEMSGAKPEEKKEVKAEVKKQNPNAHMFCSGEYKFKDQADGKDVNLHVAMAMNGEGDDRRFTIEAPNQKEWIVTVCDIYGRVESIKTSDNSWLENSTPQPNNYAPCLARRVNGQFETIHLQGESITGPGSCDLHVSRYVTNNKESPSFLKLGCSVGPIDNLTFNVDSSNPDKATRGTFARASAPQYISPLTYVPKDGPDHYQENNGDEIDAAKKAGKPFDQPLTYRDVFFTEGSAANPDGECWGRATTVVSPSINDDIYVESTDKNSEDSPGRGQ